MPTYAGVLVCADVLKENAITCTCSDASASITLFGAAVLVKKLHAELEHWAKQMTTQLRLVKDCIHEEVNVKPQHVFYLRNDQDFTKAHSLLHSILAFSLSLLPPKHYIPC